MKRRHLTCDKEPLRRHSLDSLRNSTVSMGGKEVRLERSFFVGRGRSLNSVARAVGSQWRFLSRVA